LTLIGETFPLTRPHAKKENSLEQREGVLTVKKRMIANRVPDQKSAGEGTKKCVEKKLGAMTTRRIIRRTLSTEHWGKARFLKKEKEEEP